MVNRRGQLILTAAILVALTIVASAVLLNSIHASADVTAQQERQGLAETERTIEQIQDNLAELFVVNGSEERMPYVESEEKFEAAVEEYSEQYLNMSTRSSVQLVNVTLVDAQEDAGTAIWQNVSGEFPDGSIVTEEPNNITYMSYTFEEIDGSFTIEIGSGGDSVDIGVTDSEITVDGETQCEGFDDSPLQLEIVHGEGKISVGGSPCGTVSLGSDKEVAFEDGENVEGVFRIVVEDGGAGSGAGGADVHTSDGVTINPTFKITYQDPQVTYETNVTAYGGGS